MSASLQDPAANAMEILHTSDAGEDWQRQWAGYGSPVQLVGVNSKVALLSLEPGPGCALHESYANCTRSMARGELLRTDDGGAHWREVWSGSSQLQQMTFAGPRHGIAMDIGVPCKVTYNPGERPPHCTGLVVATADGGRHWRPALQLDGPGVATARQGGSWLAVETTVSLYGTKPVMPPARVVLWSSRDASHWTVRARVVPGLSHQYLTASTLAALVPDGHRGLVLSLVDREDCGHSCPQESWVSRDGGATWRPLQVPEPSHFCGPDGLPVWSAAPQGVMYVAADSAMNACGRPGFSLAALAPRLGAGRVVHVWPNGLASALQWPTVKVGYLVATGLSRTDDAGATWQQVWPPPAPTGQVISVGGGPVFGAGDVSSAGAVLVSNDEGRSWSQASDLPGAVLALSFVSPARGFLALQAPATGRAIIETTTDGGKKWYQLWTSPALSQLLGSNIGGL